MSTVKDYLLVIDSDLEYFEVRVKRLLKLGWSLQGSPFVDNKKNLYQAMILIEHA